MKKFLAFWLAILILYGILLAFFRNYEFLSTIYHLALLALPLYLIFSKKETFTSIGFKKGNVKEGLWWIFFISIALISGAYIRAFLMHKSVDIVFDFSFLFIMTITLGPLSEEIFHRGLLQTKLVKRFGEMKGMIFPSILFALIHVPKMMFASDYLSPSSLPVFMSNPCVILFSFFIFGIMFAYIYQETKSLYYAIAAHALVNFILSVFRY